MSIHLFNSKLKTLNKSQSSTITPYMNFSISCDITEDYSKDIITKFLSKITGKRLLLYMSIFFTLLLYHK